MADEVAHISLDGSGVEGRLNHYYSSSSSCFRDHHQHHHQHHLHNVPPPHLPNSNPTPCSSVLEKTFRSELNLVLIANSAAQVDAGQPTTTHRHLVLPVSVSSTATDLTPPPNLPEPMSLLPATLPYLDFRSNTAVITTPKAALANHRSVAMEKNGGGGTGCAGSTGFPAAAATTVTSVASKPISSATAVRKKLFGKRNKEPIINEPAHAPVVPLRLSIPSLPLLETATTTTTVDDDKANEQVGKVSRLLNNRFQRTYSTDSLLDYLTCRHPRLYKNTFGRGAGRGGGSAGWNTDWKSKTEVTESFIVISGLRWG